MSTIPTTSSSRDSARQLLDAAYAQLDYNNGDLLTATTDPEQLDVMQWVEKGDWLALAHRIGAEKLFFVNNDPVIVFHALAEPPAPTQLREIFRQAWCMARPRCLFIAMPGELRVYSLTKPPSRTDADWQGRDSLAFVERVADVATALQVFERAQVETGQLFGAELGFGSPDQRADQQLIRDLKTVRRTLIQSGLAPKYAHALIGRSIFIRYLEDRGVLTLDDFTSVADQNAAWQNVLASAPNRFMFGPANDHRCYARVLSNKDFTYALFDRLAEDFNGDMFPLDPSERVAVQPEHLRALQGFLWGDTQLDQPRLFLWAYDFSVVPTELISNIYEEFYQQHSDTDDRGTHYTPGVLVEHVLSQVLTTERLATNPRILDPACGSGIFLVEAFRRLVRYEQRRQGRPLTPIELRHVLRDQLVGIELNPEAARIAAFSLYLALLHYQDPPTIRSNRLPHLIYQPNQLSDDQHYPILFGANAFTPLRAEREQLGQSLAARTRFPGRINYRRLYQIPDPLPLSPHSFDLIIGNPPWGYQAKVTRRVVRPPANASLWDNDVVNELQAAQPVVEQWCQAFDWWPIGDRELGQAFIGRSLSLLKPNGDCGLLIPTGVFLKRDDSSNQFRQRWLERATILTVINFAHVRDLFFSSAIAPFAFVHFRAQPANIQHQIRYWSAKKTEIVDQMRSVVLSHADVHYVRQQDLMHDPKLWKVYWWGNHRDAGLIRALEINPALGDIAIQREWSPNGRGFQGPRRTVANKPSSWLSNYKELPTNLFTRYGLINPNDLRAVPHEVQHHGKEKLYVGWRLLIRSGVSEAGGTNGVIAARIDNDSYCFRSSILALNMDEAADWERKVLLGIIWSSLARYYYFLTSSKWGNWHDEIYLEEALKLPVRFPTDLVLRHKLVRIVDELRREGTLGGPLFTPQSSHLEQALDEAVFDLYELTTTERDQIRDLCRVGLELLYNPVHGAATQPVLLDMKHLQGVVADLPSLPSLSVGLTNYLGAFLDIWNRELEPDGEFAWRVIRPPYHPMLAVVFTTQEKGITPSSLLLNDQAAWEQLLARCDAVRPRPISRRVYIEGLIRVVTDTEIIIIKRNEQRLWTRSAAREDAEASLVQALNLQSFSRGL